MAIKATLTAQEKKEKRQSRREKQRRENVVRSQKMHDARVANSRELLGKPVLKQRYYIGCSGWYYWDWRGFFYPDELPTSGWFDQYAIHFKTVELNAPFYSWPTIATVKTWIRQAKRKGFVYTVKVNELITHTKRFKDAKELVKDFGYIAELLGPKMGCFLFQLPPSFHYTPARLKTILSQLEPDRRNAVEFRHASWWNEKVYAAFRKAGTIFCSCSGPKLPDELIKTAGEVYVRFHGTARWYRHDYSKEELAVWAKRIKGCNAERVWVYFNNDYEGHAIANAKTLAKLLKE
jgi:uncharacterized protein YecE (DUF72 family)